MEPKRIVVIDLSDDDEDDGLIFLGTKPNPKPITETSKQIKSEAPKARTRGTKRTSSYNSSSIFAFAVKKEQTPKDIVTGDFDILPPSPKRFCRVAYPPIEEESSIIIPALSLSPPQSLQSQQRYHHLECSSSIASPMIVESQEIISSPSVEEMSQKSSLPEMCDVPEFVARDDFEADDNSKYYSYGKIINTPPYFGSIIEDATEEDEILSRNNMHLLFDLESQVA